MIRKSPTNPARAGVTRRSFAAGAGAAGLLAGTAPFNIVRAQGAAAAGSSGPIGYFAASRIPLPGAQSAAAR